MVDDTRIVTIGGGTGSSTILKGLKKYFKDITAIVTVADDGGSSGMLRDVLAITGKVLPVTLDNIKLFAELENGEIIEGESNITALDLEDEKSSRINRVFISPKYAKPLNEVVHELYNSDVILIGPGSLYTSVIPNLLISEISEALTNTKAKICFILNVVNQSTETFDYKVTDHLNAIYKHCEGIKIDTVIVNNEIMKLT